MPKILDINVEEDFPEIENLNFDSGNRKFNLKKEKMLLSLKKKEHMYLSDLASELGLERRTVARWIETYEEYGIVSLFNRYNHSNAQKFVSSEIQKFISSYLIQQAKEEIPYSCAELKKNIFKHLGKKIPYHTLYAAIRRIERKLDEKVL